MYSGEIGHVLEEAMGARGLSQLSMGLLWLICVSHFMNRVGQLGEYLDPVGFGCLSPPPVALLCRGSAMPGTWLTERGRLCGGGGHVLL